MIDFEALRKAEAEATPGRWEAEADGSQLMSVLSEPGDPAFVALARNLYLPLLDVASEAQELLTETEQLVAEHTPAGDAWMDLNRAFAALAEAVERETGA